MANPPQSNPQQTATNATSNLPATSHQSQSPANNMTQPANIDASGALNISQPVNNAPGLNTGPYPGYQLASNYQPPGPNAMAQSTAAPRPGPNPAHLEAVAQFTVNQQGVYGNTNSTSNVPADGQQQSVSVTSQQPVPTYAPANQISLPYGSIAMDQQRMSTPFSVTGPSTNQLPPFIHHQQHTVSSVSPYGNTPSAVVPIGSFQVHPQGGSTTSHPQMTTHEALGPQNAMPPFTGPLPSVPASSGPMSHPASSLSQRVHPAIERLQHLLQHEGEAALERELIKAEEDANNWAVQAQKAEAETKSRLAQLNAKRALAEFAATMSANITPQVMRTLTNTLDKMRRTTAHIPTPVVGTRSTTSHQQEQTTRQTIATDRTSTPVQREIPQFISYSNTTQRPQQGPQVVHHIDNQQPGTPSTVHHGQVHYKPQEQTQSSYHSGHPQQQHLAPQPAHTQYGPSQSIGYPLHGGGWNLESAYGGPLRNNHGQFTNMGFSQSPYMAPVAPHQAHPLSYGYQAYGQPLNGAMAAPNWSQPQSQQQGPTPSSLPPLNSWQAPSPGINGPQAGPQGGSHGYVRDQQGNYVVNKDPPAGLPPH